MILITNLSVTHRHYEVVFLRPKSAHQEKANPDARAVVTAATAQMWVWWMQMHKMLHEPPQAAMVVMVVVA